MLFSNLHLIADEYSEEEMRVFKDNDIPNDDKIVVEFNSKAISMDSSIGNSRYCVTLSLNKAKALKLLTQLQKTLRRRNTLNYCPEVKDTDIEDVPRPNQSQYLENSLEIDLKERSRDVLEDLSLLLDDYNLELEIINCGNSQFLKINNK